MKQIGTQSAKYFRKIVTFVLAIAMVITTLTVPSTDSQAATKVKKVSIGVKVGGSGILVLKKGQQKKLKATVSPKKASKKLTYKSSKKSVVSVSSKGVVKARKSKGSAKITVASAQNAKKKATITVKIGTPIKKVSINKTAVSNWQSSAWVLKEVNGQKQKVYPKYSETLKAANNTFRIAKGRTLTLKTTTSPKKVTSKKCYWTSSKKSVASIVGNATSTSCKIATRKPGKATITAKAADGSGKTSKIKLDVQNFIDDSTPAPTEEPDIYTTTDVQNFESYEVGTDWMTLAEGGATKGEAYVNSNVGTMKVVADPENPANKCLEIDYTNGDTQAYDFAPVFTVDLAKLAGCTDQTKLSSFAGIRFKCRVVANSADCQYKTIACYFAPAGSIKPEYYFDTSLTETGELYKFREDSSMATGVDKDYSAKLYNGTETIDNQKVFPSFMQNWSEPSIGKFGFKSCSPGYKESDTDPAVGFVKRTLLFNRDRMKATTDGDMLQSKTFDMVFGSTFAGQYAAGGYHFKIYIDDVQLVSADIPVTGIKFKAVPEQMVVGTRTSITAEFEPDNTTQQEVVWTTSDRNVATVDKEGNVTAEAAGTVTITATSKANPAVSNSFTITVKEPVYAKEPYKVDLQDASKYVTLLDRELKNDDGTPKEATLKPEMLDGGGIKLPVTGNAQYVVYDFGEAGIDLTQYQSFTITGYSAGQYALEFYSADTNLTFKKSLGDPYDWWAEAQWNYYPFFEGSASERMSNGHFVKKGEETISANWQYGGGKMDLSRIRYMVIKSNNAPVHPANQEDPDYMYTVKDITFSPDYAYNFKNGRVHTTSLNEALATSSAKLAQIGITKDEYSGKLKAEAARTGAYRVVTKFNGDDSDAVTFKSTAVDGDLSGMAFYLDHVSCSDIEKVATPKEGDDGKVYDVKVFHKTIDISKTKYKYVKVQAKADTAISLKMFNDATKWSNGITVDEKAEYKGTADANGVTTYYFPLEAFEGLDLEKVDAVGIGVKEAGKSVTIEKIEFAETNK